MLSPAATPGPAPPPVTTVQRVLRFLPGLCVLLALLAARPAGAQDLVLERGALEDPGGTLTIQQVTERPFAATGRTYSAGYSDATHWLRLRVRAPAQGGPVVLRIRPSFLDEIRLYELDEVVEGRWKSRVTGDRHPFGARELGSTVFAFVVTPHGAEATYYLRVRTSSSMLVSVDALTPLQARHADNALAMAQAAFLAIMLTCLGWAAYGYLDHRDAALGWFALYQFGFVLYGLAGTGYLAPLIPDAYPAAGDLLASLSACFLTASLVPFTWALFRQYAAPTVLLAGFALPVLAFPFEALAIALGHTQAAMRANAGLIIAGHWYFVAVSFALRERGAPSPRFVQAVYLLLAVLATAFQLSYLGVLPADDDNLRSVLALIVAGGASSALFIRLLHQRMQGARRQRQAADFELQLSRKALEYERLLTAQAEALANTDPLTGLNNRRHFVALAEAELERARRFNKPLAVLMLDIDRFKGVNDTRGHAVGDLVLQATARTIRHAVRAVDLVGRVGGEEFAVVVVESEPFAALEAAERIRAAVEADAVGVPCGDPVRVTISIGVASSGDAADTVAGLMERADQALYRAKRGGRNRVESAEGSVDEAA